MLKNKKNFSSWETRHQLKENQKKNLKRCEKQRLVEPQSKKFYKIWEERGIEGSSTTKMFVEEVEKQRQ